MGVKKKKMRENGGIKVEWGRGRMCGLERVLFDCTSGENRANKGEGDFKKRRLTSNS